jgi:hypothetical protein
MEEQNKIEIYQSDDKQTIVEVKFEQETIWLSQKQMAELFDKDVRTISEHIKTIYTTNELTKNSTIRKFRIVRKEGKRDVSRDIEHYNLDMIISVGYRVNSVRGTQFRQWATQRLKDYLVKGYAINEQRLEQKQQEVLHLKTDGSLDFLSCTIMLIQIIWVGGLPLEKSGHPFEVARQKFEKFIFCERQKISFFVSNNFIQARLKN